MTKSVPVTLPARPLASSSTRSATSCGWVNRPVDASAVACLAIASGLPPLWRVRRADLASGAGVAVRVGDGETVVVEDDDLVHRTATVCPSLLLFRAHSITRIVARACAAGTGTGPSARIAAAMSR